MRKTVCRKCPSCGLYNGMTVKVCGCGTDLSLERQVLTDINSIPSDKKGQIDETIDLYFKKCSECGTTNFSVNPKFPEKRCFNCNKARLIHVDPQLYVEEENDDNNESAESDNVSQKKEEPKSVSDTSVPNWVTLLNGIKGGSSANTAASAAPSVTPTPKPSPEKTTNQFKLAPSLQPTVKPARKKDLKLIAVTYGKHSFTIPAIVGENPVMLGREAHQGKFLSKDRRVGRNHCIIYLENGIWYVKDNKSSNGTFLNKNRIFGDDAAIISDGDILKLGHEEDSMAFEVRLI